MPHKLHEPNCLFFYPSSNPASSQCPSPSHRKPTPSMMITMPLLLRHKKLLISQIHDESPRRYAQSGKSTFESVPSREGSCVSPCLTIIHIIELEIPFNTRSTVRELKEKQ